MPELPEVETVVRALRAAILGVQITAVRFASARVSRPNRPGWKTALLNQRIASVSRRGKYIVMALDSRAHLVVHLRMTGRLRLQSPDAKRGKYDRLILDIEGGALKSPARLVLVDTRQFARADLVPTGQLRQHSGIAKLGPEADQITETELRRILARSHRPVKSLLLDQTALAGLGNIYVDEALHAAGIHPLAPSDLIDRGDVRRLRAAIHRILAAAILACGTTFDTFSDLSGEAGGFAPQLKVYSRDGLQCLNCGCEIERIVVAGRGTHFCPHCQPNRS